MATPQAPRPGMRPVVRPSVRRAVRVAVLMGRQRALDEVSTIIRIRAPELEVVLGATGWLQLVRSPHFPTDVVILDYELADTVSIEGRVRSCRAAGASVVVLSRSTGDDVRRRVIGAGAAALLVGRVSAAEIVATIRAAAAAEVPRVVPGEGVVQSNVRSARLSQGEEHALRIYITGRTTREVASQMNVKYETAKTYLRRVRAKYRRVGRAAGPRADLIERAAEDGYLR